MVDLRKAGRNVHGNNAHPRETVLILRDESVLFDLPQRGRKLERKFKVLSRRNTSGSKNGRAIRHRNSQRPIGDIFPIVGSARRPVVMKGQKSLLVSIELNKAAINREEPAVVAVDPNVNWTARSDVLIFKQLAKAEGESTVAYSLYARGQVVISASTKREGAFSNLAKSLRELHGRYGSLKER